MGTSDRAFRQVREILGKLDRSIDQAREKRLHGDRPPPTEAGEIDPTRRRARPLRPSSPRPSPTERWQ